VFERALRGPGTRDGWNSSRLGGWRFRVETIHSEPEYYNSLGPLPGFLPGNEQIHQFFPGGDFHFGERVTWSVGIGLAATPAGSQLIYKSRIEIGFGRTN
jgi:hypothetical protein